MTCYLIRTALLAVKITLAVATLFTSAGCVYEPPPAAIVVESPPPAAPEPVAPAAPVEPTPAPVIVQQPNRDHEHQHQIIDRLDAVITELQAVRESVRHESGATRRDVLDGIGELEGLILASLESPPPASIPTPLPPPPAPPAPEPEPDPDVPAAGYQPPIEATPVSTPTWISNARLTGALVLVSDPQAALAGTSSCLWCNALVRDLRAYPNGWRIGFDATDHFRIVSFEGDTPQVVYYLDGRETSRIVGYNLPIREYFKRHPVAKVVGPSGVSTSAALEPPVVSAPIVSSPIVNQGWNAAPARVYGGPVLYGRGTQSRWTWPGDLRAHLIAHGYSPAYVGMLGTEQLESLHDRTHDTTRVGYPSRSDAQRTFGTPYRAPAPYGVPYRGATSGGGGNFGLNLFGVPLIGVGGGLSGGGGASYGGYSYGGCPGGMCP